MKVIKDTPKQTYVTFVLDNSGSMACVKNETVSGFNEQLQAVKAMEAPDHEVFVSFVLFSEPTAITTIRNWVKPSEIAPLTINEYRADGGSTALLDAMMFGINKTEEQLHNINKGNNAALVIFVTDGGENSSIRHNKGSVKEKIEALTRTDRFTFTFMGTESIDSVAHGYGIRAGNVTQFAFGAAGMHTNSISNSKGIADYAQLRSTGATFSVSFYNPPSTDKKEDEEDTTNKSTT